MGQDMTPEQAQLTVQRAKLRTTWQRFATAHQNKDLEATNPNLDIHLTEIRRVFGFPHTSLETALTSALPKDQEVQLNLKNHQQDMPKILAKALQDQMGYYTDMCASRECGDPTLPLSRAQGIMEYLVILSRCGENVKGLSAAQIDVALSTTLLTIAQHLSEIPLDINSTEHREFIVNPTALTWLQSLLIEVTILLSFMCDRNNNWMHIVKRSKEATLQEALECEPVPTVGLGLINNLHGHSLVDKVARGNIRSAINVVLSSKHCKTKHKGLMLDLLGTLLCGGEETSCGVINDSTFSSLLTCIDTCTVYRDIAIECCVMFIQRTHGARPDKRQCDVRSLLTIFLHKANTMASEQEEEMLTLYLDLIPRILCVKDRPSLQSNFLAVSVFDKIYPMMDHCESEAVTVQCVRAFTALIKKSASAREAFEENIGYMKLLEHISSLTCSKKIVCAVFDMIVEGVHTSENSSIQNIELLKAFLRWSFSSSEELQLYILTTLHRTLTNDTLSIMRCCGGGIISVITNALSSPPRPFTAPAIEELMCILEQLGGYSISAIEVRQFILLFTSESIKLMANLPDRLQISLERMARGKGSEGPNHFFDLQHQTAGISVPEIAYWPGAKNSYSFVCWFKLDLSKKKDRCSSPDSGALVERYTLYSFFNANGYGFEAFFTAQGTLVLAVCSKKDYSTLTTDHSFTDNRWHFLGVSHKGSPLPLAPGDLYIRIDGNVVVKDQLRSVNTSQPFITCNIGGAGLRQASSKDRRPSILDEFGSFITSRTNLNKDANVLCVAPGMQDEVYGIPTSLHGQLGPVALFWEALTPQELVDIYTTGPNNLSLFQPHFVGKRKERLAELATKLLMYYNAKASKNHVVLDLVSDKPAGTRLDGRLTGHNLSTWNIKDILACVGGVQLIFPLLESIGPAQCPATPLSTSLRPSYLRGHYISECQADEAAPLDISGTSSPTDYAMIKQSGSIESLPEFSDNLAASCESEEHKEHNRVSRFVFLLEEMLRDCPTNQESLLSTNGVAVIGALLVNMPPIELNMNLVKALQSLCLLLSMGVTQNKDKEYPPLLLDVYQHILFNFELWGRVDHDVRVAHIQYLSVIIKDNILLCRKEYGVQFMLDAVRLYCSSNEIEMPDTACVLRRAIFGFVKFYMRHGIQAAEVRSLLSFIAVTPDLDQKLEGVELATILVEVPPTSLPMARCLASLECQDLLVGLLHTPCNQLKITLLKLIKTIVMICNTNTIPLHQAKLCYVGEAVLACSVDGNGDVVNGIMSVVNTAISTTVNIDQSDVILMQSLIRILPRFGTSIRLQICQELLVLIRTNPVTAEVYGELPAWHDSLLCVLLGKEEDKGSQEQLFVTVMELIHTIMWKIKDKDQNSQEYGKLLVNIDELATRLFRTAQQCKMRFFELILHSVNLDLKKSGYDGEITHEHTSLMQLLEHFMFYREEEEEDEGNLEDAECVASWSSKLVQETLLFFNLLGVWDCDNDMDLYRVGLRVLLGCLYHQSYEFVSAAASRLHTLLDHPYFESFYTASYVLGTLHHVIAPTLEDEVNQLHILLVPLVYTALKRWGSLLGLDQKMLEEMPGDDHSPDFMDDFLLFIDTHEWETFIHNQVYPAVKKFSTENNSTALGTMTRQLVTISKVFQTDIIKMDEGKIARVESYERDIWSQYQRRQQWEVNRHILDSNERHNKHHAIIKEWRERKKFMTSDRGVWGQEHVQHHWKRDTHETYSRMRMKMTHNNNFDSHSDAKFYDEHDSSREHSTANLLGVSEEARIRDDKETQDKWDVVLNNALPDLNDDDQPVFFEDCHLVTLLNVVPGTLKVSTTYIYFYEHLKDDKKAASHNVRWKINSIREMHLRRYNLRSSAIEFFLTDQTNYFLNFDKYHRNNVYSRIMALKPPKLVYGITRSPEEMLASSGLTKKWVERRISNFEYLMNLNTIAGRTYNDLSQYPVFPWVLNDYTSETIDFENPLSTCFRDLSKPIGAQMAERAEHAEIKYQSLPQGGLDPPFHWGTHYSNPAAVLYFLVRVEPYTSLHIELHGRFDHPDRQFFSIAQSFGSSVYGQGDSKELIPEFFYLPEFLENDNKFDFGDKHDGSSLDEVILPPWAKSAEDFITKHRQALESEYVSNHLNEWIDLIFGFKQRGETAVEALNVYHYTSYEGTVDLDAEKDPKKRRALEAQISNFGQTPRQLFKTPHPKRLGSSEAASIRGSQLLQIVKAPALRANALQVASVDDPVVFVGVVASVKGTVLEKGVMDKLITLSRSGVYGMHSWLPRWTGSHPFYCELDPQLEPGMRCITGPFCPSVKKMNDVVRLSNDGKMLFTAGLWDNSLRVSSVTQYEISPFSVYYQQKDIITCIEINGNYIATGARDTTIVIWKMLNKHGNCTGIASHPHQILYGHNSEVTCIDLSQEFDIVVSGSKDGNVLIHTMRQGTYVRTIVPYVPPEPDRPNLSVSHVGISDNGNICIAGRLLKKVKSEGYYNVLFLYTINSKLIRRVVLEDETSAIYLDSGRIVLGSVRGSLEVRCTDYLEIKHKLRLKAGVSTIFIDPKKQHMFVCTYDGKLLVLTATAGKLVKK